jgi:hypothetical protein
VTDVTDIEVAAEAGVVVDDEMTREEAALHTEKIKAAVEEANEQLEEIKQRYATIDRMLEEAHRRKAWKALGYRMWEEYTTAEFHMSRSRSYQLIDQARTMLALEEAIGDTEIVLPELDGGQVAAIKGDVEVIAEEIKAEIAEVVEEQGTKVSPEQAAEIIQEAIKTAKDRKAAKVTPVQTDTVEDAEIVDGEIVDSKTTYLNAAVVRLNNLLVQLNDFPEPESLIPYLNEDQLNTICTARTWLMRFPVEIPG